MIGYTLRQVSDSADLDAVAKVRYRAYRSIDAITPNVQQRFLDEFDRFDNAITFLLVCNGCPVGSIRTFSHRIGGLTSLPALTAYSDAVMRYARHGQRVVESNRFVVDPSHDGAGNLASHYLLRACVLRCHLESADVSLGAVRDRHAPFYRRMLKMTPISEPKFFPGLSVRMRLLACNFKACIQSVSDRSPMLRITARDILAFRLNHEVPLPDPVHAAA